MVPFLISNPVCDKNQQIQIEGLFHELKDLIGLSLDLNHALSDVGKDIEGPNIERASQMPALKSVLQEPCLLLLPFLLS